MASEVPNFYIYSQKGFTLLEIITSISIGMLLTGFLISNYNTYNDVQKLKQSAFTLKNNLRFIQSKSLSGEMPSSGCAGLVGWELALSTSSYSFSPRCTGGLAGTPSTVTFPDGVTFTSGPASITFKAVTGLTTLANSADIILTGATKSYSLRISPGGDISDEGLQ